MLRVFLLVLAVALIAQTYRVINDSGMLRSLEMLDYGQCEKLTGPVGAEDITIDRDLGIAYIGADDRRAYLLHGNMDEAANGDLWRLDLNQSGAMPEPLTDHIDGPFHPHGIALHAQDGVRELYVLNHLSATEHEVDVFTFVDPTTLELRARHTSDRMISPNDLAVVSKDRFFFTNDHGYPRHTVMEKAEDFLGLPLASVVYFDGEEGYTVIEGLRYPNGIAISSDEQALYVAETTGRKLKRFVKGDSLFDWTQDESIDLESGLDNLEWGPDGDLLTAAHPKLFQFMGHMQDAGKHSPSEVIRIDVDASPMQARTIMLDSGEGISGSSVATLFDGELLVGSVFEPHILRCRP